VVLSVQFNLSFLKMFTEYEFIATFCIAFLN